MFYSFHRIPFVKAQSNFSLSIGGGYVLNFDNIGNTNYWENGYLINLSSEYFVFQDISIFLNTTFQNHFFNAGLYKQNRFWYGDELSVSGKDRKMYEMSLGFRLYGSHSVVRPFVSVGAWDICS